MPKLMTCQWFDEEQALEAAEFYARTFPNSKVERINRAPTDFPGGKAGQVLTVEYTVLGHKYLGLNGGPYFKPNEGVSFVVITEDQAETDRYWNALISNGGQAIECGWCKDKWGFAWQITPRILLELTTSENPELAKRSFEVMMTMQKIEVAPLDEIKKSWG